MSLETESCKEAQKRTWKVATISMRSPTSQPGEMRKTKCSFQGLLQAIGLWDFERCCCP